MDYIELCGIEAYGYHGVLPEETRLGQRFTADVRLETSLAAVGGSDDIRDGVDYGAVFALVQELLSGTPVRTLERLVTLINEAVLREFPTVAAVTTKVYKPAAPVAGVLRYAAVERRAVRHD